MTEQNFPTFRELLRGAICTRTQAQFANDSGLSAEHLNRMLNADTIHRPTKQTLLKIAAVAKNGITYQMLKDALDQEDPNTKTTDDRTTYDIVQEAKADFRPEFPVLADTAMQRLRDTLAEQKYPVAVESLSMFMDNVLTDAQRKDPDGLAISYSFCKPRDYYGKEHAYAKRWMNVELTMADRADTAISDLLLFFTEVPASDGTTGFYVIQKATTAVIDIMDVMGMPPAAMTAHAKGGDIAPDDDTSFEEALQDPYYIDIRPAERFLEPYRNNPGSTTEEKLLYSIFGEQTKYSQTTEGFGFWLDGVPSALAAFIGNHLESVLQPYNNEPVNYDDMRDKLVAAVSEGNDAVAALLSMKNDGFTNSYAETGWPAAIAHVMSVETGFPFHFMEHSEDDAFPFLSDKDCILISEDETIDAGVHRETLLLTVCRYVKELGLSRFGDILFTNVETSFRKPKSYTVKTDTDEESSRHEPGLEDMDYVPFSPEDAHPAEYGVYAVRLKDGRHMRCVFLADHNAWVLLHREWSDLIEAYCPTPLRNRKAEEGPGD